MIGSISTLLILCVSVCVCVYVCVCVCVCVCVWLIFCWFILLIVLFRDKGILIIIVMCFQDVVLSLDSTLWTGNRCEHFWSGYCSVIMCVARCLLSWLLFAASADFLCIFGSRDWLLLLLTNCMMSLLFICIFRMYNIFSREISGWSWCK